MSGVGIDPGIDLAVNPGIALAVNGQDGDQRTVGGRLLAEQQRSIQADPHRPNSLTCGHRACRGCGEALAARWVVDAAVRATAGQLVVVNATGCLEVFSTPFPQSAWQVAWLHSLFGNAPAVASGVAAALRATGRSGVRVLAQGGDGGTVDIGFGTLSGMFERNDDVLVVCYDNQAYMNTGVQRSGATPPAARTSTTPAIGAAPGNPFGQGKNAPRIAMAHEIPYVATATVADVRDLERKVTRAMSWHGARYLHILVPCPLGWGAAAADTIRLARLAVQTGLFPLFEAEHGEVVATTPPRGAPVPVEAYLRAQRRYDHLFSPRVDTATVAAIQAIADRNLARYGQSPEPARPAAQSKEETGEPPTIRDHPGTGIEPGLSHRGLAQRAPGLEDAPRAVPGRLSGGRGRTGLAARGAGG